MSDILTKSVYDTVKELVLLANIKLPYDEYKSLLDIYSKENNKSAKIALAQILQNAKFAFETKRPLCQDTGFVTVFLSIGQDVRLIGKNINTMINQAVSDAYKDYFFRKSIVADPVFERNNTKDNTPVLIHTEFAQGDEIEIIVSIKGGGCENVSASKMLTLADGVNGVKDFVVETVKNAGSKPCPPVKIGVGIGSNFEGAAILSKKALLIESNNKDEYKKLEEEILNEINSLNIGVMGHGGNNTAFAINILSAPCHIASLPVAVSISCHSSRHASATIKTDKVIINDTNYDFAEPNFDESNVIRINTNEIEKIRNLKAGTNIELSGKIYTARDAAHKKLEELLLAGKDLPINLKNTIIFYAGPCPANNEEVIGPIGPTTSARMDKYAPLLYKNGLLATIGKGERAQDVIAFIREYNGKYFTMTGGVASLMKNCVKSAKIVAYPELGAEAVYELEVENLPLMVKY